MHTSAIAPICGARDEIRIVLPHHNHPTGFYRVPCRVMNPFRPFSRFGVSGLYAIEPATSRRRVNRAWRFSSWAR
jgi:hypothetical protein